MSVKEAIGEKIAQTRRLLHQTTDRSTAESLRTYIEELERRLLIEMDEGGSKNTAGPTVPIRKMNHRPSK
jgi:hypothetical protein